MSYCLGLNTPHTLRDTINVTVWWYSYFMLLSWPYMGQYVPMPVDLIVRCRTIFYVCTVTWRINVVYVRVLAQYSYVDMRDIFWWLLVNLSKESRAGTVNRLIDPIAVACWPALCWAFWFLFDINFLKLTLWSSCLKKVDSIVVELLMNT